MGKTLNINFNGSLYAADQPILTAANRAFRYGDGLFESIRMIKNDLPMFDIHFDRMHRGMKLLKLQPEKPLNKTAVKKEILALCKENGFSDSARIRWSVFRKSGGHYFPESNDIEYLIQAIEMKEKGFAWNKKGLKIDLYTDDEKPTNIFSNYKTCNALIYVLAAVHRKTHKLDDCLLLNTKSRVIEASNSNMFLIKHGEVYTPSLQEGCVSGVMREFLLPLIKQMGLVVHETGLTLEDLFLADEMFLSNAVTGIRWVKQYKVKEYDNTITQKIHARLNEAMGIKL